MCTVLLPPGNNPIAVNKCIIYHIKDFATGGSPANNPTKNARTRFTERDSGICLATLHCSAYWQTDPHSCCLLRGGCA